MEEFKVVVVGGGAAGLATAIFAAESLRAEREARGEAEGGAEGGAAGAAADDGAKASVVVIDGAKKLGAKILIAGGGRCNVTNARVGASDFFGATNIVKNVLSAFTQAQTVAWFESLGVTLKVEETGKLFPTTDKARTVLDALVRRAEALGVEFRMGERVLGVARAGGHDEAGEYRVTTTGGVVEARQVVIATGGRSVPTTGSDGAGYELARSLGHTVTPTYAALVPLVVAGSYMHAGLSGVSLMAELTTVVEGRVVDKRAGSLLFTHFGLSGPVVLDASRFWVIADGEGKSARLVVNYLPGEREETLVAALVEAGRTNVRATVLGYLGRRLPERVAAALLAAAGVDGATALGQLGREARVRLSRAVTASEVPVTGSRGFNYAEVTAGGVPLREIDYRTMESRVSKGLYLVGEVLDCDGRIGGFNFQWAWATGKVAGQAVARRG